MAIFNMQRRRDASQKRWPKLKESGRSIRRVTVALIFFIVTPLSVEVMADRYRYPLGDISQVSGVPQGDGVCGVSSELPSTFGCERLCVPSLALCGERHWITSVGRPLAGMSEQ